MKKLALTTLVAAILPLAANAQSITPFPGFYVGAGGGVGWSLNNGQNGVYSTTGWSAGGSVGYDFVGPRVELDVAYGQAPVNVNIPGTAINGKIGALTALASLFYDFMPDQVITPFIGAGVGVAFIDGNSSLGNTAFAYQGTLGVSYNVDSQLALSLFGTYSGATSTCVNVGGVSSCGSASNIGVGAGIRYKFGAPAAAAAAPPPPSAPTAPSYMVFFDWDRSDLSPQALATLQQVAQAYKVKGSARVTATGHTDTSGPADYNMALSLRRANAVKNALVSDGVPASAIAVVGRGETQPLVPTGDGVREPQNRRVEIVLQ